MELQAGLALYWWQRLITFGSCQLRVKWHTQIKLDFSKNRESCCTYPDVSVAVSFIYELRSCLHFCQYGIHIICLISKYYSIYLPCVAGRQRDNVTNSEKTGRSGSNKVYMCLLAFYVILFMLSIFEYWLLNPISKESEACISYYVHFSISFSFIKYYFIV
jgi:hypothetical protein